MTTESWRDDAACRNQPQHIWFPPKGKSARPAKTICATCPVQTDCLQYAVDNNIRHGIWGGLTERDRRPLRRPLDRPRPRVHGTRHGYQQHIEHGETPCWWCQDFNERQHKSGYVA